MSVEASHANTQFNTQIKPRPLTYNLIGDPKIVTVDYTRSKEGAGRVVYFGKFTLADELSGKPVVIKVTKPNRPASPGIFDIDYEYDLMRRMSGRGNPAVYGVIDTPEGKGLVEEYIEGVTLDVVTSPLTSVRAAKIAAAALIPLQELHALGAVHRDVKPANIIVTPEERVFLTDYGYAARLEDVHSRADTNAFIGTLYYMSPEGCDNNTCVGVQADIYAMGITLWELLTGKKHKDIFETKTLEKLDYMIDFIQNPKHFTALLGCLEEANVPIELQHIIARAVNPQLTQSDDDPGRYQSAEEMRNELLHFLSTTN